MDKKQKKIILVKILADRNERFVIRIHKEQLLKKKI